MTIRTNPRSITAIRTIIAVLLLSAWSVTAQVPKEITYQGVLKDNAGNKLTGTYTLLLKIYTAGGTELYSETHAGVAVANGLFSVRIGSVDPGGNPLNLPFDEAYELGITVNPPDTELSPRQPFTTAAYAFIAINVIDNAISTDKLLDSVVTSAKILDSTIALTDLDTTDIDTRYANLAGDTMTGTLNLPADGLIAGTNQLVLSNGGVGINTSTVNAALQVVGTVDATTFVGDGSALTGIAAGTGGIINIGSTTIGADSDVDGNGEIALQTGGTTKMVVKNDGKVGIGTTNPTDALHVEGDLKVSGVLKVADVASDGAVGAQSFDGSGPWIAKVKRASDGMKVPALCITDDDDQNVAIGSNFNNPKAKLHVKNKALAALKAAMILENPDNTTNSTATGMHFKTDNQANRKKALMAFKRRASNGRGNFVFALNDTDDSSDAELDDRVMTIACSGRVGIGAEVSDPEEKLHVRNTATAAFKAAMLMENPDNTNDSAATGLRFKTGNQVNRKKALMAFKRKASNGRGDFVFALNNTDDASDADLSDACMTITRSRNVGICTTDPTQALDIDGNVRIRGGSPVTGRVLTATDGNGNAAWQDNDGNVTNELQTLSLIGSNLVLSDNGGNIDFGGFASDNLGNHTATQNLDLATHTLVGNGGGSGIAIDSGGNVGIGTTTPGDKFTVFGGNLSMQVADNQLDETSILFQNSGGAYTGRIYRTDADGGGNTTFETDLRIAGGVKSDPADLTDLMTIKYDGRVGIGTTTPGQALDIVGNLDTSGNAEIGGTIQIAGGSPASGKVLTATDANGNATWQSLPAGDNLGNHTAIQNLDLATHTLVGNGGSSGVAIDSSGDVGIGTTAPVYDLHVNTPATNGLHVAMLLQNPDNNNGNTAVGLRFKAHDSTGGDRAKGLIGFQRTAGNGKGSLIFATDSGANSNNAGLGDTRMTITTDGNVGIGTTTPNYTLDVRGTIGNNATLHHSDCRWKDDITTLTLALDKVMRLRGVGFRWRLDEFPEMHFQTGPQIGFIAQEVEKVLPEVVHTDPSGFKSVEYGDVVPVLVEAIKEQQKIIVRQHEQLADAAAKLAATEGKLIAKNQKQDVEMQTLKTQIKRLEGLMQKMQELLAGKIDSTREKTLASVVSGQ